MKTYNLLPVLLTVDDLAEYTGIPVRTLDRWRQSDDGPPFISFGRHIRYPEDQLLEWMRAQSNIGSAA
ncbi:helix-turn-helix domain-containing protein [Microbacterium sp. NPDC055683]